MTKDNCFFVLKAVIIAAIVLLFFDNNALWAQAKPKAAVTTVPAAQAAAKPVVVGRTAWDDRYLYLTFQVDDVNIQGTNTAPMSEPQRDDSVAVYLQIGERTATVNSQSHAMIVSAAGGFTFLRGDSDKKTFVPRPLFSIKYAVGLQGSLNRNDDRDRGYTVEMAIPWAGIDVKPAEVKAGLKLGFEAVIRSKGGKLASLAPSVKDEADILSPAKWNTLTLAESSSDTVANGANIDSPQIGAKQTPPFIDGTVKAGEWVPGEKIVFDAPEYAKIDRAIVQVTPVNTQDALAPELHLDGSLKAIDNRIFARYRIDFQADVRKPVPVRAILEPNANAFLLRDQPLNGVGPWFSSDRIGWHRSNLGEMRRVGIDVALVQTGVSTETDPFPNEKSLLTMASALREMRFEGQPAPTVALWLDMSAWKDHPDSHPNLGNGEGRALLYNAIAAWFRLIPMELRATVQLPVDSGGVRAYPVFLSQVDGCVNWNARIGGVTVPEYLRARFAQEFGAATQGTTILLIGDGTFPPDLPDYAATLPNASVNGGVGMGSSGLPVGVVSPGSSIENKLVSRRDGETYRSAWESVADAHWVVIDSWNDFVRASEIGASRQWGSRFLDLTRIAIAQRTVKAERGIKWLEANTPRRMAPGQAASVDVAFANAGRIPLRGADGIAVSYRWLRNGKIVGAMPIPNLLRQTLFPGDTVSVPIAVVAAGRNTAGRFEPLPPGNYFLQVDILQKASDTSEEHWFSDEGIHSLTLPIKIDPTNDESIEWAAATTPILLNGGGYYPTFLRLRWTGNEPLLPADAQISYQVLSEDGTQTIAAGELPLPTALAPGRWTTVRVPLRLLDPNGAALTPAFPEIATRAQTGGLYHIRWSLARTDTSTAIPGSYSDTIAVYPADDDVRILPLKTPLSTLKANEPTTVNVTVINRGTNRWIKGTTYIGYHWYYADGIEAFWKPTVAAPLPNTVEPGQSVIVPAVVVAPERDGQYTLVFDITRGNQDNYLSTHTISHAGDIASQSVRVIDGRLNFVDLSKIYNTDAVSWEGKPTDGDLNGNGSTLPGEFFVPDRFGANAPIVKTSTVTNDEGKTRTKTTVLPNPPYPSGYFSELSTARTVSFKFGNTNDGAKNAIKCAGQSISVNGGRYVGIHIAALAVGGNDRTLTVTLRYKDGTLESHTVPVGDWGRFPTATEAAAITTRIRRTPKGDLLVPCTLYHTIAPVNVGKTLDAIVLPTDPQIKVFAITLER